MHEERGSLAHKFALQVLETCRPWLKTPTNELEVLDIGSGYGNTAASLATHCRSVVGLEPALELFDAAQKLAKKATNLRFAHCGVESLTDIETYDLIVLDNVYEHLPDHRLALHNITRALRSGGVVYLLTPNRAWPIEAHYRLPGLSWLPLPAANGYLRLSGRGTDYTEASYAPTARSLGRELDHHTDLYWQFTLPADPSASVAATNGKAPLHYRLGIAAIERFPILWSVSKALLVVAVKK